MMKKQRDAISHQKRFGQYFSGDKVAGLLSQLLPKGRQYHSIVDPMAGTGDLLRAAVSNATPNARILGVEIDPPVAEDCQGQLTGGTVICGDAFQCGALITDSGWDLVITNPPYVRYQLQNDSTGAMPTKDAIRHNLYALLNALPYLCGEEKALLLRIAGHYSGLSDMAVPSWILCAALVRPGGILAMVVPETWLSRRYAKPVQYLLMKSFRIHTIARDVNTCWFENAQVRTCLIVAEKVPIAPLADAIGRETLFLDLGAELAGTRSLIDHLSWGGLSGADALAGLLARRSDVSGNGFEVENRKTISLFPHMLSDQQMPKWVLAEDFRRGSSKLRLPAELEHILASRSQPAYLALRDLGVCYGQGLRTGANEFFYFQIVGETADSYLLQSNPWFEGGSRIAAPRGLILRCVQNRGEVSGIAADPRTLKTGLLYLQDSIRPQDFAVCSPAAAKGYTALPEPLSRYISAAEAHRNPKKISFREYSAVKPNEKKEGSQYLRFWYMLPRLTPRHLPNLCITRINSGAADCIYIPQSEQAPIAVDANFVTLWCQSADTAAACLALLNSTWSKCCLELLCTVMGGGALKIEASHIGELLFPSYTPWQLQRLSECGAQIAASGSISAGLRDAIDHITMEPFEDGAELLFQIKALLWRKLDERGAKYGL